MDKQSQAHMQEVMQEAMPLAERFLKAGHEIYLVGGIVRDLMIATQDMEAPAPHLDRHKDRQLMDMDLCTDAHPDQIQQLLTGFVETIWTSGERFGTIGCIYRGRTYEVTTFRTEQYDTESRNPTVSFGTDILEDLSRRDFTVNAMALSFPDGTLIDPFEGQADLQAGVLRAPIAPEVLFTEDPLRMLRAARFEAQLQLVPTQDLVDAMSNMAERLSIVSPQRQMDELRRLLCLPAPAVGLQRLQETKLLTQIFAQIFAQAGFENAANNLQSLTSEDLTSLNELEPDFQLRMAGLLLRFSKEVPLSTRPFIGAELISLGLSKLDTAAIARLISGVRLTLDLQSETAGQKTDSQTTDSEISDSQARRIAAHSESEAVMAQVISLLQPQSYIHSSSTGQAHLATSLKAALSRLQAAGEDPFDPTPALTSAEIMETLNAQPGPVIGQAQKYLQELYIQKGKLSRSEAISEIKKRLG